MRNGLQMAAHSETPVVCRCDFIVFVEVYYRPIALIARAMRASISHAFQING